MLKGTTYMVRPRMHPRKSSSSLARISPGAFQLVVGPASSSSRRCSRAVPEGRHGAAESTMNRERGAVECSDGSDPTPNQDERGSDLGGGEAHVDLGPEPHVDGTAVGVDLEVDALALAQG